MRRDLRQVSFANGRVNRQVGRNSWMDEIDTFIEWSAVVKSLDRIYGSEDGRYPRRQDHSPLPQAYKKTGTLTERRLAQPDAWDMLQRRAKKAGITTQICNDSWRATGITTFL
jgi:hypothetical protein